MKVRPPKEYNDLSPAQRKRIQDYCKSVAFEVAQDTVEKDGRIILDIYIKMVCKTLHDVFGFGEKRLTLFLGNHRWLFHDQRKMVQDGTQLEYLNDEMTKIFRKNGFPQHFFDKMLGPVETERTEENENKTSTEG